MGNNQVLHNSHGSKIAERPVSTSRALDLASMEAVAALLKALPLQPEESDRGDLMEAKSNLFQKYANIYKCVGFEVLVFSFSCIKAYFMEAGSAFAIF